jgi:hypothetical protein
LFDSLSTVSAGKNAFRSARWAPLALLALTTGFACEPPTMDRTPTPIDPAGLAALRAREALAQQSAAAALDRPAPSRRDAGLAVARPRPAPPPPPPPPTEADAAAIVTALRRSLRPTLLAVRSAWNGLGRTHDDRVVLRRAGASFAGVLRCERSFLEGWTRVRVSAQPIDAALAGLGSIAVLPVQYRARHEHTDDYPTQAMILSTSSTGDEGVEIGSRSQSEDFAPWGISLRIAPDSRERPRALALVGAAPDDARRSLERLAGFSACLRFRVCADRSLEARDRAAAANRRDFAALDRAVRCPGFSATNPDAPPDPPVERIVRGRRTQVIHLGPRAWEGEALFDRL